MPWRLWLLSPQYIGQNYGRYRLRRTGLPPLAKLLSTSSVLSAMLRQWTCRRCSSTVLLLGEVAVFFFLTDVPHQMAFTSWQWS
jgi:hypothetical protein